MTAVASRRPAWFSRLALAAVGLCVAATAAGFDIEYAVEPRAVNLGEPVQVSFKFVGIANPEPPVLSGVDDFTVSGGGRPQVSRNTMIVNGQVSSDVTFSYVLFPTREGELKIGPMNYSAYGESKVLPEVTILVAPAHQSAALFAKLTVAKPEVYLHEIFEVTLTIYSHQVEMGSDFRLMNMPDSRLNFQAFNEMPSQPEVVNGRVYQTKRFQSEVRALAAGSYRLAPALNVPIRKESQRRSAFDMFFSGVQMEYTQIAPEPVSLTVLPLPQEGRPDSFNGAVGSFSFEVTAQPLALNAGDPINLSMKIEGRGNMDAVSAPRLDLGPDFRVYDSQLLQRDLNDRRSHGRVLFEQVVIPRTETVKELPALEFSFFDPQQGAYRTLSQGPFALQVSPATDAEARLLQAPESAGAPELKVLHQDIVYLKPAPDDWPSEARAAWFASPLYVGAQLLPALACAASFFVARRRQELSRDVAKARRLRAPKAARSAVHRAEEALAAGRPAAFYEALWDALHSYFGDLFNLQPGEVDPGRVIERLHKQGLQKDRVDVVASLFEACEKARFAAGLADTPADRLAAHLERLEEVFRACGRLRS